MIYTMLGTKVDIVARDERYDSIEQVKYGARILIRYEDTGNERVLRASDLTADGGMREVYEAVFKAEFRHSLTNGLPD